MTVDLLAPAVRTAQGWTENARLQITNGKFVEIGGAGGSPLPGAVIPAMPNLHSHAFQRAIAGITEVRSPSGGDFWTWRQAMYGSLDRLTPDDVRVIATQLYIEMAKAGYARVCEFHYLHHDADGRPYANPAAMAEALIEAAAIAGIGLTLVPVLYMASGFGDRPAEPAQRRFLHIPDSYAALIEGLRGRVDLGIGFHSLRAVTPEAMNAVLDIDVALPVHIHIAEQVKEVDDCLTWSGARPVEWLLRHFPVDERWCLVHATHLTDAETRDLAASGATVAICPTTEANLGDGFFDTESYFAHGGRWGIGSDSHVSLDPREELRLLEYGRRLRLQRRALSATEALPNVGAWLWTEAASATAPTGVDTGRIAPGARADFIVLDERNPQIAAMSGDARLDALVFVNAGAAPVRELWVGGERIVAEARHPHEETSAREFAQTVARLRAAI
ncbi:formimidoylglutamate deiminase [Sphingoaurantiacus capsulatus]|uniref:Formimidoylglutamate deiminase n=1 Tax=Sphingoaurantiacus capsulatus TaxID=1771310 RepID=A0ABV7X470_9SPHN